MNKLVAGIAASFALAVPAWAAVQTVTLDVPGMTCSACPITVKQSLTKVPGVSKANVSFDKKEAVVTFDDAKASAETLMKATKNAGYPSTVKQVPASLGLVVPSSTRGSLR